MADVASRVLSVKGLGGEKLTERLIRHYVTMGALQPPRRIGREAKFEFTHLVQVLAIRNLMSQRLSIGQIRDLLRNFDWSQVDAVSELLPKGSPRTDAERLVGYRTDAERLVAKFSAKLGNAPGRGGLDANQGWTPPYASGGRETLVRWKLNSWCEVLADPLAVENLTDEGARQLADEFLAALTHRRDQRQSGGPK